MSSNPLLSTLYPTTPIEGAHLTELASLMMTAWDSSEIRDLDMAMALNIPPNRISHFKRAKSSIEGGAELDDEGKSVNGDGQIPMVHPNQAILIRLLMRYPHYASLVKRPSNAEVWELIQNFVPKPVVARRRGPMPSGNIEKKGFAPLFGRAAVSSYKMLPGEESANNGETSLPVARLQMLVMSRFADIFRDLYRHYAAEHMFAVDRKNPLYVPQARDWTILRERDSLTDWMPDAILSQFNADLQERWQAWFESQYLPVLRNEAISRGKDPEVTLRKGDWTTQEPVSDEEFRTYKASCKPITGSADYFTRFRTLTQTTSAEMFWVLGMQVKGFYRFRERGNQRIDASTSILIRYLMTHGNDLDYFVELPPTGEWLLQKIQAIDPDFKRFNLAPLFGASKMASYKFAAAHSECPYFARRLAMIFARELAASGPEIYWQIRECIEDEVRARGLNVETFWKEGRWHD